MPKLSHLCLIAGLAAGAAAASDADVVEEVAVSDPYLWLEDVEDPKALDWVRAQNAKSQAELASTPDSSSSRPTSSRSSIPTRKHPGGREARRVLLQLLEGQGRTRAASGAAPRSSEYRKAEPKWETMLDLDALNKAERRELGLARRRLPARPPTTRCLVALSRGGADADVTREFDLATKTG